MTANLQALVFTPSKGGAGTSATTNFTLTDTTSFGTQASRAGFSVTDTDPITAPGAVLNAGSVNGTTIDATGAGPHTVVIGAGSQNTILYGGGAGTVSGSGAGNTVTGGNGAITVSGLGGSTTIVFGDGNDTVNLAAAGANNAIVVGNGNNRIAAGNGGVNRSLRATGQRDLGRGGERHRPGRQRRQHRDDDGCGGLGHHRRRQDVISIIGTGGATIHAGLGTNKIGFAGTGNLIVNQGGKDVLTDTGTGNTVVLPLAGLGLLTIGANALSNGDVFDLRPTLAATGWNHAAGTLSSYLSTGLQGNDATVVIDPSGVAGGASYTVAVISGAGPTALSSLLPHTLT